MFDCIHSFFVVFQVLLFIRVIVSWFPQYREAPIMQPVYTCTDLILSPLREFIPVVGGVDFTPMVALFLLQGLEHICYKILHLVY